jgi:Zn-dependent protease
MSGGGLYVFSIGDIPVRVSMWYGLLLLYWFQGGDLQRNLIWAVVVTVSILFHELGHAVVARHYGLRPQILLHGLGGLCFHDRARRDRHDVLIIAAGPGAGLLLGGATWLFDAVGADLVQGHAWVADVVRMSLWVNILWSLVNLLPLWPLDGGQLFRIGLLRLAKPKLAEQITHWTALTLLGVALLAGWYMGSLLIVILAAWIGWSNVQALRGSRASGPIRTANKHAAHLLGLARESYGRGDFGEAARLCHQLRKESNVADAVLAETWRILGCSAARLGEHAEALSYLRHVQKPTTDVTEARIECLYALGRDDELEALLASPEFEKIPAARREEILGVVRAGA